MAQQLQGRLNVLNFGYAGRTTRNLRSIFTEQIIDRLPRAPALFTIWLGANDATLGMANVPIDDFERYLRGYIDQIIHHPSWEPKPKVLLVTPPPINIGAVADADGEGQDDDELNLGPTMARAMELEREAAKEGIAYRTWMSKRTYAERVMSIANSYPADQVAGLDLWTVFIQAACDQHGKGWIEGKLPGCGLPGARAFPSGYFTDGLHLGTNGYEIVTEAVSKSIERRWPGLLSSFR